jgi:dephospho-CoA kinase
MIILGLTGSIGMGKSTVASMFAAEGVPVFDADAVVHRLQGPGGALVAEIERLFPGTTASGAVDRALLAGAVLAEPGGFERLEALVHPAVAAEREGFVAEQAGAPLIVLDVPLLFEKGLAARVDKVAVVSAPEAEQRKRVLARPRMNEERFEAILARQMPDSEKKKRADFVIPTGGTLDETKAAVRAIIACLAAAPDS